MDQVTIGDVAARAGVSKATVSAVIHGHATVRHEVRERVLEAMEALNFPFDQSAHELRLRHLRNPRRMNAIGLVIRKMDNPFFAEVMQGVQSYATDHGYTLLVSSSEGHPHAEQKIVSTYRTHDVDGLILAPIVADAEEHGHLQELIEDGYPVVLLEAVPGVTTNLIRINQEEASAAATRHLIELGHERIVHFAGPVYTTHSQQRIRGFRRALEEAGRPFSDDLIVPIGAHLRDGYERGRRYFRRYPPATRPTGVTCFNDLIAVGLHRALLELGLRVPDDVSIVGYDDIDLMAYLPVPFTTVHSPNRQLGYRAAELLIRRIEAGSRFEPQHLVLEATLIERASTGPPPPRS
ncbi:MAG: LacI family transcriptional regulator [Bacteroidetes bacterium]|nr:LacI family transcriptional regulator [Rhodothermaceae bacterium RA]RMH50234.1 MAG: LacI family transcriptional regulator [Bacteroidota bacterium]